jgi:hypothetical protein
MFINIIFILSLILIVISMYENIVITNSTDDKIANKVILICSRLILLLAMLILFIIIVCTNIK